MRYTSGRMAAVRWLLLAVLACAPAVGEVTLTKTTTIHVYRGTSILERDMPSREACDARAAELSRRLCTQSACPTMSCRTIDSYAAEWSPDPPCPAQPPTESRTQQCPSGTAGTWTQTLSYVSAPSPICWAAGNWTPAGPPPAACKPVVTNRIVYSAGIGGAYLPLEGATIAGPVSVRTEHCPPGGAVFSVDGKQVNQEFSCPYSLVGDEYRYDTTPLADGAHTVEAKLADGAVSAGFTVTRPLPAPTPTPGPTPAPAPGAAVLSWLPSTQTIVGSPIEGLAGYRLHYGTAEVSLTRVVQLGAQASRYELNGLAPGRWYFSLVAYTTTGEQSAPSNVVSKLVK